MDFKTLSVVIPCCNEERTLEAIAGQALIAYLGYSPNVDHENGVHALYCVLRDNLLP